LKTDDGRFVGAGGVEIFWRSWLPDTVRAVCLICHGLGEHSGRYARVAEALGAKGLASFALDHRGHGQSGGKRGHVDAFNDYLCDLDEFRRLVEERYGELPRFLIGHSMGGLIAARYAERQGAGLAGLVLSSAALRVDVDAPAIKLFMGRVFSKLLPGITMSNELDPTMISRDKKAVEDYMGDPLVHDRVSARWFTEFTRAIDAVQEQAAEINIPVLVMQSGADALVAPRGAVEFHERLTTGDKTVKEWEGFYHEMFNELPGDRERAINFMTDWIEARLG